MAQPRCEDNTRHAMTWCNHGVRMTHDTTHTAQQLTAQPRCKDNSPHATTQHATTARGQLTTQRHTTQPRREDDTLRNDTPRNHGTRTTLRRHNRWLLGCSTTDRNAAFPDVREDEEWSDEDWGVV